MRIQPWNQLLGAALLVVLACGDQEAAQRAVRLNAAKTEGASLVEAGRYDDAIEVLAPLAGEATADVQTLVLLGDAYAGAGRTANAVAAFEDAIRLAYSNYEPHLKLATLLMADGRIGRALTEFEIAVNYGAEEPLAHYNYGLALRELGRDGEALKQFYIARNLDPADPRFLEAVAIGVTHGDPVSAVREFEAAEAAGAFGPAFDNNFGLALQSAGRLDDAANRFAAAVAGKPAEESYRFNLAGAHMRQGSWQQATGEWRDMLDRFGEHWSYRVYLGRALVESEQFDDAYAALAPLTDDVAAGKVARTDPVMDRVPPGLDEAQAILALSERGRGRLPEALVRISHAVELNPDNPSHLNNYGVILAEGGNIDDARAAWRRVLELDPENATARENLSAFEP
jgi:Flp pilus assembly protein TadD